ncbi:MAG: hypothetical protein A2W68_12685 [Betaproteobacteria bacterium RIFCSPLOWO2_02_64_14]|nr:MAG: hypothetical protein A2W68_12685 [Betaproteobacteria bacterium RIFCSPLOWO2_02_64_14]
MSQSELLKRVIARLQQGGIEHMLTGSVVSSLQGEPRATHDIDVVIAVKGTSDPARTAITLRSMFNMLDAREGDKVDFWLLSDDDFDRSRFSRRVTEQFEGTTLVVSRPEDTILGKLKWSAMSGGSEKQFTDALRVYEVQHGQLDQDYLDAWAARLGVTALLEQLRARAEPIE